MFVSYKWLQEYVDVLGHSAEELAELITRSGIEVEGVTSMGHDITNVVVGQILEVKKHPEADRLSICLVEVGEEEPLQIVCGASNVYDGLKVAVAKVGAILPGNFKIKKTKLRGEVSMGMICSMEELGLDPKVITESAQAGILELPDDAVIGTDIVEYLELADQVLELSITPNRADALSMLGVAYEVAAILGTEVKVPQFQEKGVFMTHIDEYLSVEVEATKEAPLYMTRLVAAVEVGPSPFWMQSRLMAAGIRPINNIVDITNYVLLEYGQPLHAFDYKKIAENGRQIVVRLAKEGEAIVTLDGEERKLLPNQLVITDGKQPIAIAGVMGSLDSGVNEKTLDIVLESAVFDPSSIRQTSRHFGIRSEASTRFEKGIDPICTSIAMDRALTLMEQYADAEAMEGALGINQMSIQEKVVTTTTEKINEILGMTIATTEIADIFNRLGFAFVEESGTFTVTIPTRRPDIVIPEDLAEEVGRIYGYDNIATRQINAKHTQGTLTIYQKNKRKVRRYLEGTGLFEARTYALTSTEKAKQFSLYDRDCTPVRLALPMSEERSELRWSLIPHLLESTSYNLARKVEDVFLYEIASVFLPIGKDQLPDEIVHLAAVMTGTALHHPWQGEKKEVDFFVLKGVVEGLVAILGLSERIAFAPSVRDDMHPGRTADITLDGAVIGYIGQVHPETEKGMDLKETYVFELSLDKLLKADVEEVIAKPVPRFPAMVRDMAIVVDEAVLAGDVLQTITEAGGKLLQEVHLFDVYIGGNVATGKKSLAFSLRYQDPTRTLVDEEVTSAHQLVLEAVEKAYQAELRQ